jgi:hypothetical protein
MGAKYWYKKYPVSYAAERLTARASSVVPILLEITHDKQYVDVHFAAWGILEKLDPPVCLKELYQAGVQGRLSPAEVSAILMLFLPVRISEDYWEEDQVMDWLGKQLAEKDFDQIVLDLMDEFLKAGYEEGGMDPLSMDEGVLRWLNRIYDIDLDSWLQAKAPAAFKFRGEQLARGYDPVTGLSACVEAMADFQLQEALVAVCPEPRDRKACQELLEVLYDNVSPLQPQPTAGWEQRLKDWYWSQRPSLRYDRTLLRFVPKTAQTASRPASISTSQ